MEFHGITYVSEDSGEDEPDHASSNPLLAKLQQGVKRNYGLNQIGKGGRTKTLKQKKNEGEAAQLKVDIPAERKDDWEVSSKLSQRDAFEGTRQTPRANITS